jgi:hypothetical protein
MRTDGAAHVTLMGEGENVYRVLIAKYEENRSLGRPMRRLRIILKLILNYFGGCGLDLSLSLSGCCCYGGYELLAAIKYREFLN